MRRRYRHFVEQVRQTSEPLARAVAVNLFKLMAYKDEYEVARLHSDGRFAAEIAQQFKGDYKLTFHLAPPILGRRDGFTGKPVKSSFGPWMMTAFGLLAKMQATARNGPRHLRPYGRAPDGTPADCRLSRH